MAGKVFDGGVDFSPEDFAGQVPAIGDMILNPGVPVGKGRDDPRKREIWTVVGRVFNSRDNKDYVSLIVESRDVTLADEALRAVDQRSGKMAGAKLSGASAAARPNRFLIEGVFAQLLPRSAWD